ncbi:MAG TPA: hypothetical protein ENN67_05320, partial [Firmicutes bacterium]|nr:hypothetical protein [Bacillota bacterium]
AYQWAALGGSGYNDAEVINLSMVFGALCNQANGLDFISAYVDNTIDLYGVVWSLGAGNRNTGCAGDYIRDKPQTCYNGVSVAGVTHQGTGDRTDDTYLAASKYGPVYGPYETEERLKPEVLCYSGVYSPASGGGWGNFGGTSCSAPSYSGLATVLMSAGVTSSHEIRALTFATAEDFTKSPSSSGVDFYSGFGVPDGWSAYSHIADTFTDTLHYTGDGKFYLIENVQDKDRVVLVYNKHGLVTDWKISNLDIFAYDESTGEILHQTSKVYENKEHIEFGPSDAGKNVIIAAVATQLASGLSYETYAISANNVMTELDEPSIDVDVLQVDPVDPGIVFEIQAQVANTGELTLENCEATLALDDGMDFDSGENATKQVGSGTLEPDEFGIVSWNVLVTNFEPEKTVTVYGSGIFLGALFSSEDSGTISVNSLDADITPEPELPLEPVDIDELFEVKAKVTNNESFPLENIILSLGIDTGMEFGPDEQSQKSCSPDLNPDEFCEVAWLVKVTDYSPTKDIAFHSDAESYGIEFAGNAYGVVEVIEPYTPDPLAPILISPFDGVKFKLGDTLDFAWTPADGTNPTRYWFDAWVDGNHFELIPVGGLNMDKNLSLILPPIFVELNARDGIWEWAVASEISGEKHWSDPWVINKFVAPSLIKPDNAAKVSVNEIYDWSDVFGANNYVARITGILPGNQPFYMPLNSALSQFVLTQPFYDALKPAMNYSWAVAGTTLGPNLTAQDQEKLAKLSYSQIRTFTKN